MVALHSFYQLLRGVQVFLYVLQNNRINLPAQFQLVRKNISPMFPEPPRLPETVQILLELRNETGPNWYLDVTHTAQDIGTMRLLLEQPDAVRIILVKDGNPRSGQHAGV